MHRSSHFTKALLLLLFYFRFTTPTTIESQLRTLYPHFFALILAVLSDSERETTAPQTQIPLTEKATAAGNPFPGGAQLATEEKTVVGGGGDDDARARHMCDVQYFPR